jgi:hypothetical protein
MDSGNNRVIPRWNGYPFNRDQAFIGNQCDVIENGGPTTTGWLQVVWRQIGSYVPGGIADSDCLSVGKLAP